MPPPSSSRSAIQRRLLRPHDFAEALQLLPPWLPLDAAQRAQLPALWTALLPHPGFNADVIEDVSAPPGRRLLALGMSIAVSTAWQQRLRSAPEPWVTRQLYAELLQGRTQPMSEREMARANASQGDEAGVSFMVLHYQQHHRDLAQPCAVALMSAAINAMQLAHRGHRVREIFQEAWQAEQIYMRSMGMVQRSAHGAAAGASNDAPPELFSLRRSEALSKLPGFQLREIFEHHRPRLHLRGAEQRLLRRALFDETDDEIATLLGVSPHTLKKLWRSIYQQVEARFPTLLQDASGTAAEGVRGPEKRRTLMRYLQQHLEELRPHASEAPTSVGTPG